jgi:hypothetical protein
MIVYVKTHDLSPDITAMSFTGRLIRGNKWNDVEYVVRERIAQGLKKLVLDFSELNYIDSAGIGFVAVCIGLIDNVVGIYPDLPSAQTALSGPTPPPA